MENPQVRYPVLVHSEHGYLAWTRLQHPWTPSMDTITTTNTRTNTFQRNPQRLSALYQYHNAPEVAPAHGLEYDETVHSACSDKYPVIQPNRNYVSPQGSKIYDNDHPPRIIFGMKIRTFLLVAAFMVLVVIGAAVGGAVGGKGGHENMATGEWPTDNENNDGVNDTSNINDDNNSTNTSTR
jgi:ABC-type dipeptide/oligopeptide/nickel transport system permease subunit